MNHKEGWSLERNLNNLILTYCCLSSLSKYTWTNSSASDSSWDDSSLFCKIQPDILEYFNEKKNN